MSDPASLGSTYADEAFSNARAQAAAAAITSIVGASVIFPAVTPAAFTAPVAPGYVLGAFLVTIPGAELGVGVLNASLTCTLAGAGTVAFGAVQTNGATRAGGTAAGSGFNYSSATSGAGLVTVTGGSVQAGAGGVSEYQIAAGNTAIWTFNIQGIVLGASGTVAVVALSLAVGTGTIAITNPILNGSLVFLA
jgi:hypothetical protein